MNDRFKFRAWNSEEERYEDCSVCDGKCISLDTGKGKDWILEQCTGLKDKNGTLIYECDIVRCCLGESVLESSIYSIFEVDFYDIRDEDTDCLEVIGNIHENEDLLK